MFADFLELKPVVIALTGLLLVAGTVLAVWLRRRKGRAASSRAAFTTQMLVHGALCVALAFVLSYIRFVRFPQGGAITPASMLPIMAFAYIYGFGPGAVCGVAYGLLQLLQDFYVMHPLQLLLDYPLAFGMLALTALFSRKKGLLPLGVITAGIGRFLCHFLSGMIFFAAYAIEQGQTPFLYSLLYNLSYVGPDLLICLGVSLLPGVRTLVDRLRAQYRPRFKQPA